MHGVLPTARAMARDTAPAPGPHETVRPDPGCEDRDWFYAAGLQICGVKDPGYQLHLFTGVSLTTCRYYFAKNEIERRRPSPEFLRILFRSNHGEPFFRAFMHGCEARWFTELLAAEERARFAEQALRDIHERSLLK